MNTAAEGPHQAVDWSSVSSRMSVASVLASQQLADARLGTNASAIVRHDSPDSDSDMDSNSGGGPQSSALNGGLDGGGRRMDSASTAAAAAAADAEGVWSPDIEQAFQEALAIYPPCGRRKIILSDEGKMYGRNELIARYIKLRTGKTRTRKQVSSHIQVLARKKARELQSKLKDQNAKEKALNSLNAMSSAQIVSISNAIHNKTVMPPSLPGLYGPTPFWQPGHGFSPPPNPAAAAALMEIDMKPAFGYRSPYAPAAPPPWEGRTICTPKIRLCEFNAYCIPNPSEPMKRHEMVRIDTSTVTHADPLLDAIELSQIYDKFPTGKNGLREMYERGPGQGFFLVKFWADISFSVQDEQAAIFAVDSKYETNENMTISVSTKVCSFGKQAVEKVEHEYSKFENGRFVYRITRSPMCEYMNNFIHKLKKLPERRMMNSVLDNFTILQLVTNKDTQEPLLCIAFVFEVSDDSVPQYRLFRLTDNSK